MKKLLSYNFKQTRQFIIMYFIILLLAFGVIYSTISIPEYIMSKDLIDMVEVQEIIRFLLGIIFHIPNFILLFFLGYRFVQDIEGESSYLLFLTPNSSNNILKSRVLSSLLYLAISLTITYFGTYMIREKIAKIYGLSNDFRISLEFINIDFIIEMFTGLFLIYFSIVVTKVIRGNKKIENDWIWTGILIWIPIIMIRGLIVGAFPYYLVRGSKAGLMIKQVLRNSVDSIGPINSLVSYTYGGYIYTSIAGILFSLLIFIVLYIWTRKLMEEKLDI